MLKKLFCFAALCVAGTSIFPAEKPPEWVNDYKSVYPEKDWVCVVESATDRERALAAAQSALARIFKIDIKAVSEARESISQTAGSSGSGISQKRSISSQVNTSSDIKGLMGVVNDYWKSKDGTVYVSARINRKDGAAAYTAIIKDNDKVIGVLTEDAKIKGGTFDAYEYLTVAKELAVLTDSYLAILSVLNPDVRKNISVSYGNAANIQKTLLDVAGSIVVFVSVKGDKNGRLDKAFEKVFTSRGFRTSDVSGNCTYILNAGLTISEVSLDSSDRFARYELKAELATYDGTEILAFSGNGRAGHISYSEAEQRAVRKAEESVGNTGDEDSFACAFDTYLISLLEAP